MGISPALEQIFRPFGNDIKPLARDRRFWNGTPASAPATTTDEESREGVLTWSARADVQVSTLPGMNVRMLDDDKDSDRDLTELARTTTTRRVFNPEDSSQYVDVEVIDTLTVVNKAKQKRIFTLDNGSS